MCQGARHRAFQPLPPDPPRGETSQELLEDFPYGQVDAPLLRVFMTHELMMVEILNASLMPLAFRIGPGPDRGP